ncbi:type II secretion system F family protein [Burkholderia sp. Ac-20365]|uniref:type II secretion system F family protein n=1 Tax=Burkholderia sp. Ac-20365 TaxID=2703897 RepID=UPI00197BE8C4|nr:type II secretion system F family protein [Burkholderia sp. Ac-20365]MBN3761070.1 type II secretion system protein [Burkholderia sp. Ac-20365]
MSTPILGWATRKRTVDEVTKQAGERARPQSLSWSARKRLYEQASSQLDNERTLPEILLDYRDRLLRRGKKNAGAAANLIYRRVIDGDTFTVALGEKISPLERSVIAAGEKAGELSHSMRLVLQLRDRLTRIRRSMQSSFFAPTVYLISLWCVLFTIGYMIVPQFEMALPANRWTGWARVLYLMGSIAVGWAAPVFVVLSLAVGLLIWKALPNWTGEGVIKGRAFCDKYVFPFTVYREVQGFAWLLAFATLLRSNVPDADAIYDQMKTATPWERSRLRPIHAGLKNGLDMAKAMRLSGYEYPSLDLIDEVNAYVGFPNFPEKIEVVARQYADTLERRLLTKGMVLSAGFSGLMFFAFVILQLGANEISSLLSSSVGHF